MVTRTDIGLGLKQGGIKSGDTVLVHSSLRSFGFVEGGADTVIQAFLDVLGEEGTLVLPELTGKYTDSPACPPVFDVLESACWTGRIPETGRKNPKARRSLHPTHSVSAIGGRRDELVSGHENGRSPCDEMSPYYKNCNWKGYILLIGVDQESNTTIHCCEEIAGVPYHLQKEITEVEITGYDKEKLIVRNYLHDWYKPATDFMHLDPFLEEKGIMRKIKIGASNIRLIDAAGMLEETVSLLRKDPMFLVKHD